MSRRLPKNWDTMSLGALYERLNDPRRRPTPQSVVDAICHSVAARGLEALKEPDNLERLCRAAGSQRAINERIERLLEKERQHGRA
jgi:hypothetical protein